MLNKYNAKKEVIIHQPIIHQIPRLQNGIPGHNMYSVNTPPFNNGAGHTVLRPAVCCRLLRDPPVQVHSIRRSMRGTAGSLLPPCVR